MNKTPLAAFARARLTFRKKKISGGLDWPWSVHSSEWGSDTPLRSPDLPTLHPLLCANCGCGVAREVSCRFGSRLVTAALSPEMGRFRGLLGLVSRYCWLARFFLQWQDGRQKVPRVAAMRKDRKDRRL